MSEVTLRQRAMARKEFGVRLSKGTDERVAVKVLKSASGKFFNKKLWDNKLK